MEKTQEQHNKKYLMQNDQKLLHIEVMQTAFILDYNWSHFILEHAFVKDNPNLNKMAKAISEKLGEFYIEVGQYETKAEQEQKLKSQSNELL